MPIGRLSMSDQVDPDAGVAPAPSSGPSHGIDLTSDVMRARIPRAVAATMFEDLERPRMAKRARGLMISIGMHCALGMAVVWAWQNPPVQRPPSPRDAIIISLVTLAPHAPKVGVRPGQHAHRDEKTSVSIADPARSTPHDVAPAVAIGTPLDPTSRPRNADTPLASSPSPHPASVTVEAATAAEAPAARASVPPVLVAGRSPEEAQWEQSVISHLERYKRYPAAARDAGLSGAVLVRLVLDRDGRLLAAEVASSNGIAALDQAALEMATRASPYPTPPSSISGDAIRLLVPVEFTPARKR